MARGAVDIARSRLFGGVLAASVVAVLFAGQALAAPPANDLKANATRQAGGRDARHGGFDGEGPQGGSGGATGPF